MSGRRCAVPGCGRFIRAGVDRCARHQHPALLAVPASDEPAEPSRAELSARFREKLEQGSYRALFDEHLTRVINEAAHAVSEHGLVEEIGALRVVLARLLAEEDDVGKLAAHVTRVVSVAIQAARAQRAISGEVAQSLTEAITKIIAELDG